MASATREARIKRAERAIREAHVTDPPPYRAMAIAAVDAAGPPRIMGAWEVSVAAGCSRSNLNKQTRLPSPFQKLAAGSIYNGEEILPWVDERNRRRNGR